MIDKGTLIVTHENDGTVTVLARTAGEQIESNVNLPISDWQSFVSATARTDLRWLIEAPGPRYLAVQRLHMSDNFEWTTDHNKALAFMSQDQADALMMAVRQLDRQINGFDKGLFGFEATLGNAAPVEHGWIATALTTADGGGK